MLRDDFQYIPGLNERLSDEEIIGYMDPFYAECRAYGRIRDRKLKNPVAVACHGFLAIPSKRARELKERFGVEDWARPEVEITIPSGRQQPFRALVKDFVDVDPPMSRQLLEKIMYKDLKTLHKIGIYVMDIATRNYKGGKLVDFGKAWTEPFVMCDLMEGWYIAQRKEDDFAEFDEMVKELGIVTNFRASPNLEYISKLRKRGPNGRYAGPDAELHKS
jgi:hypothetical protein